MKTQSISSKVAGPPLACISCMIERETNLHVEAGIPAPMRVDLIILNLDEADEESAAELLQKMQPQQAYLPRVA